MLSPFSPFSILDTSSFHHERSRKRPSGLTYQHFYRGGRRSHKKACGKKSTKELPETLKGVYLARTTYKAALTLDILMIQSFMAGLYLGMAPHLYLTIGGGILSTVCFPTSLIAVLLTSVELFTGDALIFVAAVLGG
jgi:hypothetical protein